VVEESGKGIALVILGIVAIIAIVGLVLLFTGAKKAAVGEFVVSAPKEYGGAIRGVMDPNARAFSGRAYEYPSGMVEPFEGQSEGRAGAWRASYGDIAAREIGSENAQLTATYNRQRESIPSMRACQWISFLTYGNTRFGAPVEASAEVGAYESMGRKCIVMNELKAADWQVLVNEYGLNRDAVVTLQEKAGEAIADGAYACCEDAGLTGTV